MTTCCSKDKPEVSENHCPACHGKGISVSRATLLHQLHYPENLVVPSESYYYCPQRDCEIGYFTQSGMSYGKSQLREYDHLDAGWLCYCFDISLSTYQTALQSGTHKKIKQFVIEQTKTGTCACATRNPSGQCCLADFKRLEKESLDE